MSNILLSLSRVTRWLNRKYRKERFIQNYLGRSHVGGAENYDPLSMSAIFKTDSHLVKINRKRLLGLGAVGAT